MRNGALAPSERFVALVCAGLAVILGGSVALTSAAPSISPTLISVSAGSTRAVALESVSMRAEPFSLSSEGNFSPNDPRTRITLFVMNLDLLAGETQNSLTADAEDAAHVHYPLKVEYVGQVPNFEGIYMVVMRLNDLMTGNLGDLLVRLNLHGMGSNRVRVAIGQIGGGPADDPGAVGTPAPQTPPPPPVPLTIAQFQAQFNNAAFPSDRDRRRFLEQATWGPSDAELVRVTNMGYVNWINDQFSQPPLFGATSSNYPPQDLYPTDSGVGCPNSNLPCRRDHYSMFPLQIQFFQNSLTRQDQLRQRTAFALHQLIPVSGTDLNTQPAWVVPYLQILDRDAFGNFRKILMDITLNPGMGEYLNMRGNSTNGGNPNENYAREIMQLFSVGVDTLNQDGTPKLDAQGSRIPTYIQADITNFARVFTGWDLDVSKPWIVDNTIIVPNFTDPMILSNNTNRYDLEAKTLLTDINHPIPVSLAACAGASCTTTAEKQAYKMNELNVAIDNLFNHPNTGPYLCSNLIHQLVTSNASPAYVGRCAATFNANRVNPAQMQEVIKSILLDPEARGDVKTAPDYGHLRSPVLLATNLLRTFNATSDGNLTTDGTRFGLLLSMGMNLFNPPTVFSYYPARFALPGTDLIGPEYGILDTSTSYKRANFVNALFISGIPLNAAEDRPSGTQVYFAPFQAILTRGGTPANLVDALDTAMMHNTLSLAAKANIVAAVTELTNGNATTQAQQRTQTAIYLLATSSQYQVER